MIKSQESYQHVDFFFGVPGEPADKGKMPSQEAAPETPKKPRKPEGSNGRFGDIAMFGCVWVCFR